ncbi:hypothetical protein B7P43_G03360 [Cryptotermes secundus]|uniref:C2H2-type domain-containing protein n=1 Tax=Cryptotermes secundus TaxID=105785 RepID=A0A2J7QXX2_9NEOP|nr:hypothetical protein B7P43_G03360 [Cryptotermes secundus]
MEVRMEEQNVGAFGPLEFSHPSENVYSYSFRSEVAHCLFCSDMFKLPEERTYFSTHLFVHHQFEIADMEMIANMSKYCNYWRSRFLAEPPNKICSRMLIDAKGDGTCVNILVLGKFIPEDKKLREDLHNKQMMWVLTQKINEREDKNFSRKCLLCRLQFKGCRADYLSHLSRLHNMQLGQPENLVFIDDLLNCIETRLESLHCLFCNKLFKNQTVLKEHMRKKQHKKINPKDTEFDKFYIINYLEMGKNWRQVKNEPDDDDDDDELSNAENSDRRVSVGNWSDWEEDEDKVENPVVCLFCERSSSFDEIQSHMNNAHGFDFTRISVDMDFYHQVKLVNYVRRQVYMGHCPYCDKILPNRRELLEHMSMESHFIVPQMQLWDQPEYFFPTYENDSFLCHLNDHQDDMAELHLSKKIFM